MVSVAIVGLGKMGLSHLSIIRANPIVDVVGVCDSSAYILGVLEKYTGVAVFSDYEQMLDATTPDAVIVATPSRSHGALVRAALERNLHVFCEKPFSLDPDESLALAEEVDRRGVVNQVGYHNRFVGAFGEVKRLLDAGAIGEISHVLGEAYGPVALKAKGGTWRSQRLEGGGCLYDYAAHPLDLMTWYLGEPTGVGGTVLNSIFSKEIDDEVYSTLYYPGGRTGQLSVNWSDESYRKMTTRITVWGSTGRIYADRQECQVYLRDTARIPAGYEVGWNVRYTTELTPPVGFYVRGEEYSAQLEDFVNRIQQKRTGGANTFRTAAATDRVIALIVADAEKGPGTENAALAAATAAVSPVAEPTPWPAVLTAVRELIAAATVWAGRIRRRLESRRPAKGT